MDNFVAIDVETANYLPTSICAIGAVKVVGGEIVESFYELVKPEPNWYITRFTKEIHGIGRCHTDDKPCFDKVWQKLTPFIGDLPLVAHNKAFDERCIRATFRAYNMDYPDYPFYCTLQRARTALSRAKVGSFSLPYLCQYLNIPFSNHHNALADAVACAKIAIKIL